MSTTSLSAVAYERAFDEAACRLLRMDSNSATDMPVGGKAIKEVEGSRMHAIVIGIDKYQSPTLRQLRGAVRDADAIERYLRTSLRVPETQIVSLRDEQASRVRILDALHSLHEKTDIKTGDPILIYFAGHGTTLPAPNGWLSASGKIQAIVPCDCFTTGTTGNTTGTLPEILPIPDRTLGALLHKIAEGSVYTLSKAPDGPEALLGKGDNITVIFDCCYAGSGTRDAEPVSEVEPSLLERGFERDDTIPATLDQSIWAEDPDHRSTAVAPGSEFAGSKSHVLLAACSETQRAQELNGRGAFTTALLLALEGVRTDQTTYLALLYMIPHIPGQTPQCEGTNAGRILFNALAPSKSQVLYEVVQHKGAYVMRAGTIQGISLNTLFAVYATDDFSAGQTPLTTVEVKATRQFESDVVLVPQAPVIDIPDFYWALQTSFADEDQLNVHVPLDDVSLAPALEAIAKGPALLKATVAEQANIGVVTSSNGKITYQLPDKLISQYGLDALNFQTEANVEDIYSVFQSAAHFFRYLRRTPAPHERQLRKKFTFDFHKLVETDDLDDDFQPIMQRNGDNLIKGGLVHLEADKSIYYGMTLENLSNVDLYVWLYYFDCSNLSIVEYYASPGHTRNAMEAPPSLPAQKTLDIGYGASGTTRYRYVLPDKQKLDVGILKLFVSTRYVDFSGVQQSSPADQTRAIRKVKRDPPMLWDAIEVPLFQRPPGSA